jgi:hypothetical protein
VVARALVSVVPGPQDLRGAGKAVSRDLGHFCPCTTSPTKVPRRLCRLTIARATPLSLSRASPLPSRVGEQYPLLIVRPGSPSCSTAGRAPVMVSDPFAACS